MVLVQVQLFGTGTRYDLKTLRKCGKNVKTKSQNVLVANSYICRHYRGKNCVCVCGGGGGGGGGGGAFCSLPILNRVDLKHWETQLNFTNSEREKASSWTRSCWSLPIWRSAYLSANFQLLTFISNPEQSNRVTRYKISKQYLRIIYL